MTVSNPFFAVVLRLLWCCHHAMCMFDGSTKHSFGTNTSKAMRSFVVGGVVVTIIWNAWKNSNSSPWQRILGKTLAIFPMLYMVIIIITIGTLNNHHHDTRPVVSMTINCGVAKKFATLHPALFAALSDKLYLR